MNRLIRSLTYLRVFLFILGFLFIAALNNPAFCEGGYLDNKPAPETADQLTSGFDLQFDAPEQPVAETFDKIADSSSVNFKLRNYYLSRSKPNATDPEAWAQGGSIEYKLGRLADVFSLNAEYFGSFPLHAPDENDGTLLLKPGQDDIDVFGVANPQLHFLGQTISTFRQKYDLPFLNTQDNRNVPNTFVSARN